MLVKDLVVKRNSGTGFFEEGLTNIQIHKKSKHQYQWGN
jgi:hypothetical protein